MVQPHVIPSTFVITDPADPLAHGRYCQDCLYGLPVSIPVSAVGLQLHNMTSVDKWVNAHPSRPLHRSPLFRRFASIPEEVSAKENGMQDVTTATCVRDCKLDLYIDSCNVLFIQPFLLQV